MFFDLGSPGFNGPGLSRVYQMLQYAPASILPFAGAILSQVPPATSLVTLVAGQQIKGWANHGDTSNSRDAGSFLSWIPSFA